MPKTKTTQAVAVDRHDRSSSRAVAGAQKATDGRRPRDVRAVPAQAAALPQRGRSRRSASQRHRIVGENWTVHHGWPAEVPVTPAEIEVVETYLGGLLDELLAACGAS